MSSNNYGYMGPMTAAQRAGSAAPNPSAHNAPGQNTASGSNPLAPAPGQGGIVTTAPDSVPPPGPGQAAPPSAPNWASSDPNQSPQYLAFLRASGLSGAQAQATTARQNATIQAQLEAQRPMWAQTLQQGLRSDLNNAAARGVTNGSNRIQNQNMTQQNVNMQQNTAEANAANQIANNDAGLQQTLLGLQQQQAEQGLQAQQSVYNNQLGLYGAGLTNYYLQQLMGG